MRASQLTGEMIEAILTERLEPQPQIGEPTTFCRRTRQDGNIGSLKSLDAAFDFIRMLDADGYPPAFLETGKFCLEFGRASLKPDCIIADVKITKTKP